MNREDFFYHLNTALMIFSAVLAFGLLGLAIAKVMS